MANKSLKDSQLDSGIAFSHKVSLATPFELSAPIIYNHLFYAPIIMFAIIFLLSFSQTIL